MYRCFEAYLIKAAVQICTAALYKGRRPDQGAYLLYNIIFIIIFN